MKTRKLLSILLVLTMALSLFSVTTFAEEPTTFENFKAVQTYTDGQFKDVTSTDWFSENVKSVFVYGLMVGRAEDYFATEENMTVAEAMTIAARLNSIYKTGQAEFGTSDPWYLVYTDYCKANGIADIANYEPNALITRGQFADIFAKALPKEALAKINEIDDNAIPDVKTGDAFSEAIYELYRAGVLVGNDEKGTFAPNTNIKRMEVTAITGRMAVPAQRQKITLTAQQPEQKESHTVTFDLNYDNKTLTSVTVKDGGKVTAPQAPTRSGYRFAGWYTAATDGTEFDFSKTITADVTIYAHWNKISSGGGGSSRVKKTTKTMRDILATSKDFPTSESLDAPINAWVNESNPECRAFIGVAPDDSTVLYFRGRDGEVRFRVELTDVFTKIGNDYVYEDANCKITCSMKNGKFASVKFEAINPSVAHLNGTYSAPTETKTTVADILPGDFPEAIVDEENYWKNSAESSSYKTDELLVFVTPNSYSELVDLTAELTEDGDNWKCTAKFGASVTFVMSDGALDSIVVSDATGNFEALNGTYTVPAVKTISTIADVLATYDGEFPSANTDLGLPEGRWQNADNTKWLYRYIYGEMWDHLKFSTSGSVFNIPCSGNVTASGTDYVYTDVEHGITVTFGMTDKKLTSITLSATSVCDDTYAPAAGIKYMAWDDTNKKLVEKSTTEAIEVTSTTTTLDAGKFYIVKGADVTTGTITVNGTAESPTTLILADGAKLTATGGTLQAGIKVKSGNALVITGQSGGTGTLIAKGNNSSAGIGGDENDDGGTVTINGGNITANGGECGAGIGGGDMTDGGTVTINGGVVTANGGKWGAGIGGGDDNNGGTVTINGGIVTATGGDDAAAIGGGRAGEPGTLTFGEGVDFTIEAGTNKDSTQTMTAAEYAINHSAKYVGIEESAAPEVLADGYYLVGKLNGTEYWTVDKLTSDMKLEANESVPGEYKIDWTFCAGDGFKVAKVESGAITKWYKDGMDNEFKVTAASGNTGEGTLYFRPEGNEEWTYFYLTVKPKAAPAPVINTIADVLKTVSGGFPSDPSNAWTTGEAACYSSAGGGTLAFTDYQKVSMIELTTAVTADGTNWKATEDSDGAIITFIMQDGVLKSIVVTGSTITKINGTYAPAQ